MWLVVPGGNVQPSDYGFVATFVFVVCFAGMGITLHGLVGDARKLALELARASTRSRRRRRDARCTAGAGESIPHVGPRHHLLQRGVGHAIQHRRRPRHRPPTRAVPLRRRTGRPPLATRRRSVPTTRFCSTRSPVLSNAPGQWLEWADRYLTGADGAEVLSVGRDVTGRHDAELRLAESEATVP